MARIDYETVARSYHESRARPLDDLAPWKEALAPQLRAPGSRPVVDIGSGTGIFALALATWFDVEVVGVEPSEAMRAEAERRSPHPLVRYVPGRAEDLPLPDGCCGAAWLSTVVHHVDDLDRAAAEMRRVLVPGAPVLVRQAFPERDTDLLLYRFFPAAREVVADFPTQERAVETFEANGFTLSSARTVPEIVASSLAALLERVRLRADTGLRLISDADFAEGLAAMERAAAAEIEPQPQVAHLHLLVLR